MMNLSKSRKWKKEFECGHKGFGSNCKKCEDIKGLLCYPKNKEILIKGIRKRNGLIVVSGTPIQKKLKD